VVVVQKDIAKSIDVQPDGFSTAGLLVTSATFKFHSSTIKNFISLKFTVKELPLGCNICYARNRIPFSLV
jgi:hypothetical protein